MCPRFYQKPIHPSAQCVNNPLYTHFLLLLLIHRHAKLIYCLFVQSEKASGLSFLSREFSAWEASDIKLIPYSFLFLLFFFCAKTHTDFWPSKSRVLQPEALGPHEALWALCSGSLSLWQLIMWEGIIFITTTGNIIFSSYHTDMQIHLFVHIH